MQLKMNCEFFNFSQLPARRWHTSVCTPEILRVKQKEFCRGIALSCASQN